MLSQSHDQLFAFPVNILSAPGHHITYGRFAGAAGYSDPVFGCAAKFGPGSRRSGTVVYQYIHTLNAVRLWRLHRVCVRNELGTRLVSVSDDVGANQLTIKVVLSHGQVLAAVKAGSKG